MDGRRIFTKLLAQADMLVHGYRPGALDDLGFDEATRRPLRPGLMEISLDATAGQARGKTAGASIASSK